MDNEKEIASFKFFGEKVTEGVLGAKDSSEILASLDDAFQFYLKIQLKKYPKGTIQLPVRIKRGSWEAIIPETITDWIVTTGGLGGSAYFINFMKEMAKKDADGDGFVRLGRNFVLFIINWIRARKHTRTPLSKVNSVTRYIEDGVIYVRITNERGELLTMTAQDFDQLQQAPDNLLSGLIENVEEKRELKVRVDDVSTDDSTNRSEAIVEVKDRPLFIREVEKLEVFPELKHGMFVELQGHTTSANENANSIGFRHQGVILICTPQNGSVAAYRSLLFRDCIVSGYIDRASSKNGLSAIKPRIRFTKLELETDGNGQATLFG